MLITPGNYNRITIQSEELKHSVDTMNGIRMDIDTLYRMVQDETENLLSEWTGSSKDAFQVNAQSISEKMNQLFGKMNNLSENTASLERSMTATDEEAKEAATGRVWCAE